MRIPPPLSRGDVVRVVAPSSPFDPEQLARGVEVLERRLGLVVRRRDDLDARRGYLAGDDARRAAEWREAVADPDARAIFCARGGYGATRILSTIDPAPLLAAPKLVVGFSDVTAIHVALNRAGLATVHGPVLTQLGRAPEAAVAHLEALLRRERRSGGRGAPAPGAGLAGTGVIREGRASGPILGGSLTLLAHLCGTPWQPNLRGAIVLLEDVGEKPYKLDRYLTQLRLAGVFAGVAGVAVGQLADCDAPGLRGADVVRELVAALGVPAIDGIPAGHEDANFAVPLGACATLVAPASGEDGSPRLLFDGWLEADGGAA
ncbi:S66 peptidase family protein [Anaeromyxobacter oryzae]|uniref:Muramoyltetrapeptide carboxypeptidase n=1 Tax=Anaeromyxobacter oryzae TaxID=2918170 RepID=A0ABN6MYH5_9BACT|nr:LD-carboxypeptidase [Anaeromyxobacter oryzae]BDG04859.1 muramoyltetrapeptide carboxypeptidase [Anaeromyxobacter oryzae]